MNGLSGKSDVIRNQRGGALETSVFNTPLQHK